MNHNQPMPKGGKRTGAGRPPLPHDLVKSEIFRVRCTKTQKQLLQTAWGDILKQTETKGENK